MKRRRIGRTALAISDIGFGGASIGQNDIDAAEDAAATAVLTRAWDRGVRHFDTAPHYGLGASERRLGEFLTGKPRGEFTISNKVGLRLVDDRTGGLARRYDYTRDGILRAVDESLQRTGLDRFDILLVHDIGAMVHGAEDNAAHLADLFNSGLPALQDLRVSGVVSAIGLGVNEVEVCRSVLARADLDIILLAGRYTLLDRSGGPLLRTCVERDVSILLGVVFNTGILATGAVPGALYQYRPASPDMLARTRAIEAVCVQFGVPLSAAALQFAKDHPAVAATLVATADVAQFDRNLADLTALIPSAFWDRLATLDIAHRITPPNDPRT